MQQQEEAKLGGRIMNSMHPEDVSNSVQEESFRKPQSKGSAIDFILTD